LDFLISVLHTIYILQIYEYGFLNAGSTNFFFFFLFLFI